MKQDREIARRAVEEPVADRPDRRLGSVAGADFPEDRLHMSLHGRLRDLEEPRHVLVGVSSDDALQDRDLARGQILGSGRFLALPGTVALYWRGLRLLRL